MIELDYSKALLRPDLKSLSPAQQRIERRAPPIEVVKAEFRFDAEWNRLLRLLPTGDWEYINNNEIFVKIGPNEKMFPIWRIKSLLVLGTANGIVPHKSELLERMYPKRIKAKTPRTPLPVTIPRNSAVPTPSLWEVFKQTVKMEANMTADAMVNFRAARKAMGFVHTSAYIPFNKMDAYSIMVDRFKAERMLEICDLPASDPARIALSNRNFADMPDIAMVNRMANLCESHKDLLPIVRDIRTHMEIYTKARGGMSLIDPGNEDEYVSMISIAITHSYVVNALWKDLQYQLDQVQGAVSGGIRRKK